MPEQDRSYKGWSDAFLIFAKYDPTAYGAVAGEHDIIYAGPSPSRVTPEDIIELERLGWHVNDEYECFHHNT